MFFKGCSSADEDELDYSERLRVLGGPLLIPDPPDGGSLDFEVALVVDRGAAFVDNTGGFLLAGVAFGCGNGLGTVTCGEGTIEAEADNVVADVEVS